MCDWHARGILDDLFRSLRYDKAPRSEEEATALGETTTLTNNFLTGIPNIVNFRDGKGVGIGGDEARKLLLAFLEGVKQGHENTWPKINGLVEQTSCRLLDDYVVKLQEKTGKVPVQTTT